MREDGPIEHVQRREQVGRVVANVVMGLAGRDTRPQWQDGLGSK